jgi:hypothetical protein
MLPLIRPFTIFTLLVSICLPSCIASNQKDQEKRVPVAVVQARLGKHYLVTYNRSESFALCQQKQEADHLKRKFKYLVVRLSDNAIVHEGDFQMGSVHWHDDKSIEVSGAARITDESGNKKIIEIVSNQF